jgi:hypothetical protein
VPLDIVLIAATVVGKVLLPFFQRTSDQVADHLGQKVGEEAAGFATNTATTLWQRIKSKFSDSDTDRVIAAQFEEKPDAAASLFESHLKEKLEQDPAFAEELAQLLDAKSPDGSGNVMQIFGTGGIVDARGAHVEGGFIAGYVGNVHTTTPGPTQPPGS